MQIIILGFLMVWVFILTLRTKEQTKAITNIEKKLSRFKVVKKKTSEKEMENQVLPQKRDEDGFSKDQSLGDISEPLAPAAPVQEEDVHEVEKDSVSFETLLVKKILPTVGVLSVLLGLIFMITWSYTNNFIGPATLIILAVVASAVLVFFGEFLRTGYPKYYGYVTAAGMLGMSVSVYASHGIYNFISTQTAFILYIVVIACTFGLALAYSNRLLSFLASVGSFIIPFLVTTNSASPYELMGYCFIVFIAGAVVMYMKGWRETVMAVFASLLIYAGMMVGEVSLASVAGTISPMGYLVWLYGSVLIFTTAIVLKVLQEGVESPKNVTELPSNSTTGSIISLLASLIVVNILGYMVFQTAGWEHFGFFVLVQGFILYVISMVLVGKGLSLYRQLFVMGTLGAVVFATVFEFGFETQAVPTTVALFVESFFAMFVSRKADSVVGGMYKAFALIAQALGIVGLFFVDGFAAQSFVMLVAIMVALYHARVGYEINKEVSNNEWGQIALALILFLVWNYSVLPAELAGNSSLLIPYLTGTLAVGVLAFLWSIKSHTYIMFAVLILAVCNAVHFVVSVTGDKPDQMLLGGFIAVVVGVYLPLGIAYYQKTNTYSVKDSPMWDGLTQFGAITLGALFVWFGYWWFAEPITTVFVMMVGTVFILFGLQRGHDSTRTVGLVIVGAIMVKLYVFDIWSWSTIWKFAALLPLGILLISLPFWYQKLKK